MLRKSLQFASATFSGVMSVIIPVFYPPQVFEKELDSSRTQTMLRSAEKTLRGNASYLLERKFRDRLITILRGWITGQTSFETSKSQLNDLIATRSRLLAGIIPYYGVSQLLIAFGFFSSSQKLLSNRASACSPSLANMMARFGIFLRSGFGNSVKIHRDIVSARLGLENEFSNSTAQYISINESLKHTNPKRVLIIATGPKNKSFAFEEYDRIFFILTRNSRLEELANLLKHFPVEVILNFNFATTVLRGPRSEEWKRLLLDCQEIYTKPPAIKMASELIGKDVKDGSSNFIHLWGSVGQANMAQWAAGLVLKLLGGNALISLAGASLFVGEQTYANPGKAIPEENQIRKEFGLCISLAHHNPVTNFLFMKKLWINNRIEGDSQFSSVVEKSLENYLEDLDVYQGKKRA